MERKWRQKLGSIRAGIPRLEGHFREYFRARNRTRRGASSIRSTLKRRIRETGEWKENKGKKE